MSASFPASLPSYGVIPDEYKKERSVAADVESIAVQLGTVKATSACSLAIATADSAKTVTIASGSLRIIDSKINFAGTCAITVSTTGATHGERFRILRTNASGASAGVTVSINGLHQFTAAKKFGCNLVFAGAAWTIESIWQEA